MASEEEQFTVPLYVVIFLAFLAFSAGRGYQQQTTQKRSFKARSEWNFGITKSNTIRLLLIAIILVSISWFMFISSNDLSIPQNDNMDRIELIIEDQIEHIRPRRESLSNENIEIKPIPQNNKRVPIEDLGTDDDGDYPWGHIYRARIWCSVLTMWPERKQNIEVWS